jgi:excisionase family DNA binding protein
MSVMQTVRCLSRRDAAAALGVSVRGLDGLIKAGRLRVVRPTPRRVLVDAMDLERYVEVCKSGGEPQREGIVGGSAA